MTRYEPPAGISPSMAAYLRQGGECKRALAAGIISLAAQGYVRIDASKEQFYLLKIRDADESVCEEESALLLALFPKGSGADCAFDGADPSRLGRVLRDFQESIDGIACPDLLSPHTTCWIIGIVYSLVYVPLLARATLSASQGSLSVVASLYFCVWIALGAECLTAALRLWPVTLRKILSRMPGVSQPPLPFKYGDANPVFLTTTAVTGFCLLAIETSANFAWLIAAIVIVGSVSRHLLEAPTKKGRQILLELRDFKEFLLRTGVDRLSSENHALAAPLYFEKLSAYAVALEISRGRGEEFATLLSQALELDQAYSFRFRPLNLDPGVSASHFLQLNLRSDQEYSGKSLRKTNS